MSFYGTVIQTVEKFWRFIKIGENRIDTTTKDTLELIPGEGVKIEADVETNKITFKAAERVDVKVENEILIIDIKETE